jgi:winged helix DNA-binding protein
MATRDQVLAFRLAQQHLAARLPHGSLIEAARCGLQNTPPGTAALALHARVTDLAPAELNHALAVDKTLLQVWSVRAAPYIIPTRDVAVFTAGLLPENEEALRFFMGGAGLHLDLFGMTAAELVERTAAALPKVLDGRDLTKDELGIALARQLGQDGATQNEALWNTPDGFGNNRYGETLVRFALSVVALRGLFCIAPRRGTVTTFLRMDQWLGAPLPPADRAQARAELVRRYLHYYGPSTAEHFAAWAGIVPAQAAQAWHLVEDELAQVAIDGRSAWLLQRDIPQLIAPEAATGARLLPPHDPYLLLRDRTTLIPNRALQRYLWRASGNPGVVLLDGLAVALWRPRKRGRRLGLTIEWFRDMPPRRRDQIEAEAVTLAPFKDCTAVEIAFAEAS